MRIVLPEVRAIDEKREFGRIVQLASVESEIEADLATSRVGRHRGHQILRDGTPAILVVENRKAIPDGFRRVLLANIVAGGDMAELSAGQWLQHELIDRQRRADELARHAIDVESSWSGSLDLVEGDPAAGRAGLRPPQLGALHAIHAHWSVSNDLATIVLPTGVGKTDTMIAALISAKCAPVLVLVPTDALRTQIAASFLRLGCFRRTADSTLRASARYPIVGTLSHVPTSAADVAAFCRSVNVIVSTSQIVARTEPTIQHALAGACCALFIDEAHHAEAPSWQAFRSLFRGKKTLQFTATPFREDGRELEGTSIYRYPLRRAQEEGYFRPIEFRPIQVFDKARRDIQIATEVLAALAEPGRERQIAMARVDSVERAKEIFELYRPHEQYRPVLLYSELAAAKRKLAREELLSLRSRIVVCVDMLGEGFDLPELKVAAFHDAKKSVAVTIQLAGRFVRAKTGVGDAVVIANTADPEVKDELSALYARDPDWNILLPGLADRVIAEGVARQEFFRQFGTPDGEIALETVLPSFSAIAYRTACEDWMPREVESRLRRTLASGAVSVSLNETESVLVAAIATRRPVKWATESSARQHTWGLLVMHWWRSQSLLFIHASDVDQDLDRLAALATSGAAQRICGEVVFRALCDMKRLRLNNLGRHRPFGKNVRYSADMGSHVGARISDIDLAQSTAGVIVGSGYANGQPITAGAARGGKLWSVSHGRLDQFIHWCHYTGRKLLDDSLDVSAVLRGTLRPQVVHVRPPLVAISLDWPAFVYADPESRWSVTSSSGRVELWECELAVSNFDASGSVEFQIEVAGTAFPYLLELFGTADHPEYRVVAVQEDVLFDRSGNEPEMRLSEFLTASPPVIWFSDGSALEGNSWTPLPTMAEPYDRERIEAWDWSDTDITVEAHRDGTQPNSVQARVIREAMAEDFEVVFDDDGSGEAADVVAIRPVRTEERLSRIEAHFFHCKYSKAQLPGARVGDLYELCGQVQKSVQWKGRNNDLGELLSHILRREEAKLANGRPSGFARGSREVVDELRQMSKSVEYHLAIVAVQPGLSRRAASMQQLLLLGATASYLTETRETPFRVVCSE